MKSGCRLWTANERDVSMPGGSLADALAKAAIAFTSDVDRRAAVELLATAMARLERLNTMQDTRWVHDGMGDYDAEPCKAIVAAQDAARHWYYNRGNDGGPANEAARHLIEAVTPKEARP